MPALLSSVIEYLVDLPISRISICMKQSPTFILLSGLLATLVITNTGCKNSINYPEGGYDYPKKVEDSNYYYYPFQNVFSRRDSFWNGLMYVSYKAFDEPNLSLRPM